MEDLEDVGSNFDGAPNLEFRMAKLPERPAYDPMEREWLGEGVRAAASQIAGSSR